MTEATSIKGIADSTITGYRVDPRKLNVKPGWNGRNFDDPETKKHVDELAKSIAEVGVKKPLDVFMEDGKLWVSDGECRLRAVLQAIKAGAEIATVPVMNEVKGSSEADRLLNQIVGNAGKTFGPLEKAGVYKRLIDFGWKEKDIAAKSGVSTQHVRDMLQLLAAPTEVKDMIKARTVSPTLALATVKKAKGDGKAATKALKGAVGKAKASGKKKATARHVPAKASGQTFKQEMTDLVKSITFLAAVKEGSAPLLPGMTPIPEVTVRMPAATWERLSALLPKS